MIIFTLAVSFVQGLGAFPYQTPIGQQNISEENAVTQLTGLTGGLNEAWLYASFLGAGLAILASILVKSFVPVGIYLFGLVFWTAYIRTFTIFSVGDYIPYSFLVIFSIGMIFIFMAAVIGMLTGSG